jgi:hypothetical protein
MSVETSRTLRVLGSDELELVSGGHDATIMPVFPPARLLPDVPPPHLPGGPDIPPPNDIKGPVLRL